MMDDPHTLLCVLNEGRRVFRASLFGVGTLFFAIGFQITANVICDFFAQPFLRNENGGHLLEGLPSFSAFSRF